MSYGSKVTLLSNAGTGNGAAVEWVGGYTAFFSEATYGGGSVKLQVTSPNGTWIDVASASHTAAGMILGYLPAGQYRAVATTATANYAYLVRVNI